MGLNSSTLKLCSENRTKEEGQKLFKSAFFFTIISTITLYAIILVLNFWGVFSSDALIRYLIPLGAFPLITNTLFMLFVSYFQAIRRIKLISRLTIINKLISIAAILVLTYYFGINGYYIAYNLSFGLMILVCLRLIKNEFSREYKVKEYLPEFGTHFKYAKMSMLSNLFADFSAYIDIVLISYFVSNMHEIGFYSFALTMTVIFRLFPASVQQITSPYFSNLSTQKVEFSAIFKRYSKILYIAVGGILLVGLLIIPPFVNLIFDGKYENSMHYFYYLAIGWSILQLGQLQASAIFGMGKISYNLYISLFSFLINMVIYSITLYYFGLIGVAVASILASSINLLLSRHFYKKAYRKTFVDSPNL